LTKVKERPDAGTTIDIDRTPPLLLPPLNPRIYPMTGPVGASSSRRREIATFTLLAFVVVPALSIAAVGGYGLCVWMYQLVAGPPGL
jgi:nitrate reductase NapE